MSPLEAALADDAARARRRQATRAFATWWHELPALAALRKRLDALAKAEAMAPERIALDALDAARPLLEDIEWVPEGLAALAQAARADPLFEPPLRPISHDTLAGLQLFGHPLLTLGVTLLPIEAVAGRKRADLGPRSLAFTGRRSLLRVVRAGGATLDLWQAPPADGGFSAATAAPAQPAGRINLTDGMILPFDGARRSWTIARAHDDIVFVQASARTGGAPLMIEYDAATGAYVSASASDGADARMQLIATTLRRMGRRDAAPALRAAAAEAPFFLRWHIARELAALDRDAALPLLDALARDDPHPEVRAAAAASRAQLAA